MLEIAGYIDHTLLKADAGAQAVIKHCQEAMEYGFAAVCILPHHITLAKKCLVGSGMAIATVVGFPLGGNQAKVKAYEAVQAVRAGANELDVVLNIAALKDADYDTVEQELKKIAMASQDALLKVIIETCYLTEAEKIIACQISQRAGADFVKTSTGFGNGGATVADVSLMRQTVGPDMGIKAAGGITSYAKALEMISAGANRIGTSSGVAIVKEHAV